MSFGILIAVWAGLTAGAVHVVTGPDHLAAVAPLSADRPRAWVMGIRWGLGHALGLMVVGLFSLLFRESISVAGISAWAERLVGVSLVGIGLWGLRKAMGSRIHGHEHQHGGRRHNHWHFHLSKEHQSHSGHSHAAFFIGMLHGAAGTAHLFAVLPAVAFPSWNQALTYLGSYGAGTLAAMGAFCGLTGWFANKAGQWGESLDWTVRLACSAAAIGVGGYWLLRTQV